MHKEAYSNRTVTDLYDGMHVRQEITGTYFKHHHQCPANILTHLSILVSSYRKQPLGMKTNPVRNTVSVVHVQVCTMLLISPQ